MSDEAKRFPATELKLERLRSEGIVPQSKEVLLFAAFIGVGMGVSIALAVCLPDFELFAAELVRKRSVASPDLPKLFERVQMFLAVGVLAICGCTALAVALFGLLQTRFLIVVKQAVPSLGRMAPSFSFAPVAGLKRAGRSILLIAVVLLFLSWFLTQLFYDYNQQVVGSLSALGLSDDISRVALEKAFETPLLFVTSWARFFFMSLLFMLFFLGLGCYLIDYFSFHRAQRMTRSELEEEYREMETSGDFDASRRELLEES